MSDWLSYQIGRIASDVSETNRKVDDLTHKVDSALSWAQRLVLLGLSILAGLLLNYSPDKTGEALAAFLKALR
jgi:hypothetical protein